MRILHTADWHIGQTLNGWSREAEHRVWLDSLADVIAREKVDVLLVAGDVFDGINPSGEAQRLLYSALIAFRQRRPGLTTILISGNHDPAARLEAPSAVLETLDVHVVGTVQRQGPTLDLDHHMIALRDATGQVQSHVLAIPFLRAGDLPGLSFATAPEGTSPIVTAARQFHDTLAQAALARAGGHPIVAMGHVHCAGGLESEGAERRILMGGEHALPVDVYPPAFDYVALGHLHRCQALDGGRIRYSGSCFPLSASEIGYRHSVLLLDMDDTGITATQIEMPRPAAFHLLGGTTGLVLSDLSGALDALDLSPDLDKDLQPVVFVTLQADAAAAVVLADAEKTLALYPLRLGGLRILRAAASPVAATPMASLEETQPEDLFIAAFERTNLTPPEPRHLAAFRDASSEV